MKKLLWFGNLGDKTSFARVSYSFLKEAQNYYDITVLTNNKYQDQNQNKDQNNDQKLNCKIVNLGSDTTSITLNEYIESWKANRGPIKSMECMMKYSLIQMIDIVEEWHPDYFVMCNGIYEADFFMAIISENQEILSKFKDTKIIVWTPIDYIPTINCVSNFFSADYLFTMNPVMTTILQNLHKTYKNNNKNKNIKDLKIKTLGHGSDIHEDQLLKDIHEDQLLKEVNNMKDLYFTGSTIDKNDIIILNANNFVPRKRHDLTIIAFNKLLESDIENSIKDRLKLWIHTDLKKFNAYISSNIELHKILVKHSKKIILSNNSLDDSKLILIYKICKIGLQTSTGEGFSLTNCEHSLYNKNSIQVVPNFLATGHHFKDGKGLLINVKTSIQKNEENQDVIIGIPILDDIVEKLKESLTKQKTNNYEGVLWSEIVNIFNNELLQN